MDSDKVKALPKPWHEDERFKTATEVHAFDAQGGYMGCWYGEEGRKYWAQWCGFCGSYFTRAMHRCPRIISENYNVTPAIPPINANEKKRPKERLNSKIYEATLSCGHTQYVKIGEGPLIPCPSCGPLEPPLPPLTGNPVPRTPTNPRKPISDSWVMRKESIPNEGIEG